MLAWADLKYWYLHCHAIEKKNGRPFSATSFPGSLILPSPGASEDERHWERGCIQWIESRNCDLMGKSKENASSSLRSVPFSKLQISLENVSQKCTEPSTETPCWCTCGAAPIWRPENGSNIWILFWLSMRLFICIEQTSFYINTFPNALTSKKAKNHEIGIYFSANAIVALCHALSKIEQNTLVSKRSTPLSCKIVNRYKYIPS